MALTKISGSILKDPLNLGEVSIGGTLTYQDVTNVDALGIGTFRSGINVSGGQVDVGSNIKLGNAGVITATSFHASTAFAFTSNNGVIQTGSSGHTLGIQGGATNMGGRIELRGGNSDGDIRMYAQGATSTQVERLRIDSSGRVLIGSSSNNTDDVGDSALQVHTLDDLHPAIRVNSASNNGYTMFGDAYKADESQVNIGISHSSSSLVLSQGCKVNISTDDAYVSSQDTYSTRPNVLRLDSDGSLSFHNTANASTTPTDNAVSLTERFRINRVGNVSIGGLDPVPTASYYDSASLHIHQTANAANVGSQIHLTTANKGSAAGDGSQVSQYNGSLYINNQDDGNTYFYNDGSPTATILGSNGNFGINTQSPTDKLDVNGTAIIRSNLYLSNNTYLASNKGIYFDGGTSANNYLDDFEEGNFTVSVKSTNGGAMNGSFSQQSGRYTKIGRMVHIRFDMTWSGWTNYNGAMQIDNLPFTNLGQSSTGGYGAPKFRDCSGISNEIKLYGNSSWFEHNSNRIRVMAWNSSGTEFYVSPNQSGRVTGEGVMYTEV